MRFTQLLLINKGLGLGIQYIILEVAVQIMVGLLLYEMRLLHLGVISIVVPMMTLVQLH